MLNMSSKMLRFSPAINLLKKRPGFALQQSRKLNLLEFQAKKLLQDNNVTVQKFRVASNNEEALSIPKEFPCKEYVIKAQVLAGGRGN